MYEEGGWEGVMHIGYEMMLPLRRLLSGMMQISETRRMW